VLTKILLNLLVSFISHIKRESEYTYISDLDAGSIDVRVEILSAVETLFSICLGNVLFFLP
jgi:hypothetical protein